MKLAGMDGNIFSILGRAARLLRENGQSEQAKEMADRVYQSGITTRRSPLSASMWKPNCRSNRLRDSRRNGVTPDE